MDRNEEKRILETATEKLDLYVPSLLKYVRVDDAREFLEPGGQYVRFALKYFLKELIGKLIKPVGEWKEDPKFIDLDPVFEAVKKELSARFQVSRGLIGYIFSEFY